MPNDLWRQMKGNPRGKKVNRILSLLQIKLSGKNKAVNFKCTRPACFSRPHVCSEHIDVGSIIPHQPQSLELLSFVADMLHPSDAVKATK